MAPTIDVATDDALTLAEFVHTVTATIDGDLDDNLPRWSEALRALANNRTLVADAVNAELHGAGDLHAFQADNDYSAQTVLLARGTGFVVRANLWLPQEGGAAEQESRKLLSSYELPHDHDFTFLTVGFFGPGYHTSIWEYDPSRVVGRIGEPVDLEFLEHTSLPAGKVMLYRASQDIHSQAPPESLSVSLNLLLTSPEGPRSQYAFDVEGGAISGVIANGSALRTSLCQFARLVGDGRTVDLLDGLAATHPDARLRWSATEALIDLDPAATDAALGRAAGDGDELVRLYARAALDAS
jgi:hypothetical protein